MQMRPVRSRLPARTTVVSLVCLVAIAGFGCTSKAEKYARTDPLYCAEFVAGKVGEDSWVSLGSKVGFFAEAGRFDDALRLAKKREGSIDYVWAMTEVAHQLLKAGERGERFKEIVDAAYELARSKPDIEGLGRSAAHGMVVIRGMCLVKLTPLLKELGRHDEIAAAIEGAEALPALLAKDETRAIAACAIGAELWKHGFEGPAERLKQICLRLATAHLPPDAKASVKSSMYVMNAGTWAEAGQADWAQEFLAAALQATPAQETSEYSAATIAEVYADAGLFEDAEAWLGKVTDARNRIRVLVAMAKKRVSLDQPGDVAMLVPRIEALIPSAGDSSSSIPAHCEQYRAMDELAEVLLLLGDKQAARKVLAPAVERFTGPEPCSSLTATITVIGLAQESSKIGDFRTALEVAEHIQDPQTLSSALAWIGVEVHKQGHKLSEDELAVLGRIVDRWE